MDAHTAAADMPLFPAPEPPELRDPEYAATATRSLMTDLTRVVERAGAADLTGPTPCEKYDVAALRDHVVGWADFFGQAFSDPGRTRRVSDPTDYAAARDERDPASLVSAAGDRLVSAVHGTVLQGEVAMSQSRMTAPSALAMVLGEYVLHGWDLARATGQEWQPDETTVGVVHRFFAEMIVPEYRGGDSGFFQAEVSVPEGASPLDRLLGFAGRDPAWKP